MMYFKLRSSLLIPLTLLLLSAPCLRAQELYFQSTDVPALIVNGSDTSQLGFFGGLRYPRVSNIDLNFDNIQDIFIYDENNDKVICFIGNGDPNNPQYTHSPYHETFFPKLYNWAVLVDYNCDGLPDIFTGTIGGAALYENTSRNGELQFKKVSDELQYYDEDISRYTNIYVNTTDVPAIGDVDGDGDIDILSFDSGGGNVQFYSNQSQEQTGTCDELEFRVETYCWGMFREGATGNSLYHEDNCWLDNKKAGKHAGSNMLLLDEDGDGDQDLLLSDVSAKNLILLENGKNDLSYRKDTIIRFDTLYPTTKPVDIDMYPAAFYVDLDFDGVKDLYVGPGPSSDESYVVNQSWWYKNIGTNAKPKWQFKDDDLFQSSAIDLGIHAYPAHADVDGDGDVDMIVAAPKPAQNGTKAYFTLYLYTNIGTAQEPVFRLSNDNFLNLFSRNLLYANPSFGDVNQDGAIDLIIGLETGGLLYYENTASAGDPFKLTFKENGYTGLKTTGDAAPVVFDWDDDGKNDFLVANDSGYVEFWQNKGSGVYEVAETQVGNIWVGLFVPPIYRLLGYATLDVGDFDNDGKTEMAVGNTFGYVRFYDDVAYGQTQFTPMRNRFLNPNNQDTFQYDFGKDAAVALADINQDSIADLFVGTANGGVQYFTGVMRTPIDVVPREWKIDATVYPNPANTQINIQTSQEKKVHIRVCNALGEEVYKGNMAQQVQVDISTWPPGYYYINLQSDNGHYRTLPFMKQ